MLKRIFFGLLVIGLLVGCQGQWTRVDQAKADFVSPHFTARLPVDWVSVQFGDELIVTKDGPSIQKIVLSAKAHDKAFEAAELSSSAEMLPSELAKNYVAELKKEDVDGLPSFTLKLNRPVTFAGVQGFHIIGTYRTEDGIPYVLDAVGAATAKQFVSVSYTSPEAFFYERNLNAYKSVVTSLRVL